MNLNLYSKRKRAALQQAAPEAYRYDTLPQPLRVQIVHIWAEAVGARPNDNYIETLSGNCWELIERSLAREFGLFQLGALHEDPFVRVQHFFLNEKDVDRALDIVEFTFTIVDSFIRNRPEWEREDAGIKVSADAAITELNARLQEHGVGYRFESGHIIRVDSEYVHQEAVQPAFMVLRAKEFAGANEEFVRAHEHYRHRRNSEAITEALKAFESTLKTICDLRRWKYGPGDTAKRLIEIVFDKGLIPASLQSEFHSLRTVLESGLPTVRNKHSGHGQGSTPVPVPPYLAGYALNLAASNIVLLVSAHQAKR